MSSSVSSAFDLIVIGAGINGAAVAREGALSGLKVLVVERGDVGGGTTSASSRLIHGGLRYLEHAELALVYESLRERERLLRTAAHLVRPLELCIPIYRRARRQAWQVRFGLRLYDLLAFGKSLPDHRYLQRDELLARMQGLRSEGLVGGATYFDAQIAFPERLVVENLRDAVDHGADLLTYARVTNIRIERGSVAGVEWRTAAGEHGAAAAPLVVNAAGPWVDEVLAGIRHRRLIGGTKGSHLIVEAFPGAPDIGVYVEAGADARPLFVLPWNGRYLIGTTDERFDGDPSEAIIDDHEWAYLVAETESVFPGAAPLAPRVLYTHSGVRPLPHRPRANEGSITRKHLVRAHRGAKGLYSIVGGKLTTHRAVAEDVLRALRPHLPRLPRHSPTLERALPGHRDAADRGVLLAEVGAISGRPQAERLWSVYGAAALDVARLARDRELATTIDAASRTLVAELVHALEREWATTLIDVLQRRCMAGANADFGLGGARHAAEWLARLGVWDRARAQRELELYDDHARRARARELVASRRPPARGADDAAS